MGNQIVCPHCKKTISNNSIIDDAAKGEGSVTQSMICDCGERITYWQITAQLRDQKKLGRKFQTWFRNISKGWWAAEKENEP
jgi:hypothetical protein